MNEEEEIKQLIRTTIRDILKKLLFLVDKAPEEWNDVKIANLLRMIQKGMSMPHP